MKIKLPILLSLFVFCLPMIQATTWKVGSTKTYTKPSQVATLVQDGDTVLIDAGVYNQDATKWTRKNLYIKGLGTNTNRTILRYTGDVPNGKGIFVFETNGNCDNAKIENIVFDGAQVSDANGANGAGIRFQAKNLTIVNCVFTNCQNGVLEGNGNVTSSNVNIYNSFFINNGYQKPNDPTFSGYEHHIYIGASADTLNVFNCCFFAPRGQANSIKTRAQRNFIINNIIDEDTGYGSWELNIAQGGLSVVVGNVFVQGKTGANHGIVGYDAATNALQDFYFVNNTVVNKYSGNVQFFNVVPSSGITTFKVYNNIFASTNGAANLFCAGNLPSVLDSSHNVFHDDYTSFGFVDPENFNYDILAESPAVDAGILPGTTNTGLDLRPTKSFYYFYKMAFPRQIADKSIDAGAYEFHNIIGVNTLYNQNDVKFYPNPVKDVLKIECLSASLILIYDNYGREVFRADANYDTTLSIDSWSDGVYLLKMKSSDGVLTYKKFIVKKS